jgi:ribA/ribD-fused uncharacterized protein
MPDTILFSGPDGPYGFLSNLYIAEFHALGRIWYSVEHLFQAQKAEDRDEQERVRKTDTPLEARALGRQVKLCSDWETYRDAVMELGLERKFSLSEELEEKLIDTSQAVLIYDEPGNSYWGNGRDGAGKNRLGEMLMTQREKRRALPEHERGWFREMVEKEQAWEIDQVREIEGVLVGSPDAMWERIREYLGALNMDRGHVSIHMHSLEMEMLSAFTWRHPVDAKRLLMRDLSDPNPAICACCIEGLSWIPDADLSVVLGKVCGRSEEVMVWHGDTTSWWGIMEGFAETKIAERETGEPLAQSPCQSWHPYNSGHWQHCR